MQDGSRYFITVNCKARGINALCANGVSLRLLESVTAYEQRGLWFIFVMMVMPDHLHLIASFPREPGLLTTMQSWKRYFARTCGIDWQSGFFEHRLRNEPEFDEKMSYVLLNPVRKLLASSTENWPHKFVRGER
ncbi:MAG TPA: hypothetical protein PKE12_08380 [Kiritimatiellia bacterium]|nr:hypothetical protein [Kiritimatiellia bacterium]